MQISYFFIWDESENGNVAHLAEHGVMPEEAMDVIENARPQDCSISRSSGKPIVFGTTRNGRNLIVVYEVVTEGTLYIRTAYDMPE